jgi:hypothetical protein
VITNQSLRLPCRVGTASPFSAYEGFATQLPVVRRMEPAGTENPSGPNVAAVEPVSDLGAGTVEIEGRYHQAADRALISGRPLTSSE